MLLAPRRRSFAASVCLLVIAFGACTPESPKRARLVEYGWDCPDTAYVRAHVAEMEQQPFDGVAIMVRDPLTDPKRGTGSVLGWRAFGRERFRPEQYQHAIDDLRAAPLKKFRANFIPMTSNPGNVDWFDPAWENIIHNARCLARVAKQGGCIGLLFDPEQYNHTLWTYSGFPVERRKAKAFDEYVAMARQRGREFIRAINEEFPDLAILTLYGPSLTVLSRRKGRLPTDAAYSLLLPFYEGLCEAASPGTLLVDGYEGAYGFKEDRAFKDAARVIREEVLKASACPDALRKHLRVGFGLWLDNGSGKNRPWDRKDFSNNYFAPREWAKSVRLALANADPEGFVWIYSQQPGWWSGKTLEPEYIRATELGRHPDADLSSLPDRTHPMPTPRADLERYRYDEQKTFGDLLKTHTEVVKLPEKWRFQTDPKEIGEPQRWFAADFDDKDWKEIRIDQWWETQGYTYDGVAWYRCWVDVPELARGQKLELVFGAVDESAWVWVNGQKVGEHDEGEAGWDKRFSMDVTNALRPAQRNLIAVKVLDRTAYGGIWRSAKLLSSRP